MTEDEALGKTRRKCTMCGADLAYSEDDPCDSCADHIVATVYGRDVE